VSISTIDRVPSASRRGTGGSCGMRRSSSLPTTGALRRTCVGRIARRRRGKWENVVLLGPPGVGKSHLAIRLGLKTIERGYRVLLTTAAALIAALTKAAAEGRLDDRLKIYTVPNSSSSMRSATCRSTGRGRTSSSNSSVGATSAGR